ncbi:MAG: gamma-glutamyl-gamma-aminobutyrate hydrolase family protein [Arenicellales bacterium]
MKIGILETGKVPEPLSTKHGDYPAMFERLLRSAAPQLQFAVYHVTEGQLPNSPDECDAWLITGSRHGVYDTLPWIEPLKEFLRTAYSKDVPIVGICFGHQILAEALGGTAEKSHKGWALGVQKYLIHRKPSWMTGVDGEFSLNALHQDQVTRLPEDAEVVAGSGFCPYAVLVYRGSALSIQPHPEFQTGYLRDLIGVRRGKAIPEQDADAALKGLGSPIDTAQVAQWIVQFLEERLAPGTKTA